MNIEQFYFQYLMWQGDEENYKNNNKFFKEYGLCSNAWSNFCYSALKKDLEVVFGKDEAHFNSDMQQYREEKALKMCHLNVKRIHFVRRQLLQRNKHLAVHVFLRDWLKAALGNEENRPVWFSEGMGLCDNFVTWSNYTVSNYAVAQDVMGLKELYPFNKSPEEFKQERLDRAMHKNTGRIAFAEQAVLKHYAPEWLK